MLTTQRNQFSVLLRSSTGDKMHSVLYAVNIKHKMHFRNNPLSNYWFFSSICILVHFGSDYHLLQFGYKVSKHPVYKLSLNIFYTIILGITKHALQELNRANNTWHPIFRCLIKESGKKSTKVEYITSFNAKQTHVYVCAFLF